MAEYLIQDTTLNAIANAINSKTGGSSAMTPAEMVTEIGNIPTSSGDVWELHEITGIVTTSSTDPYTLLNTYISKCSQWCYFPTSASPRVGSVARGMSFSEDSNNYYPINLLGDTGSTAGNTAITNNVYVPGQFYVNDQSVSSIRSRGNVNSIPAGTYTLKFYGVAK